MKMDMRLGLGLLVGLLLVSGTYAPLYNPSTTGSPVSGEVSFFTGPTALSGDPNLTWDNTAKTLNIGTGNAVTITTAALTGNRTFTLPDANSNPVQPSTCATNTWASGVAATGVISCVGYPLLAPNGGVTTPQFSFASDTQTGLYRVSAGVLGITTGGALVSQFSANGLAVPLGTNITPTITSTLGDTGVFFGSAGQLGIGNTTDGLWCKWANNATPTLYYQCVRGSSDTTGFAFQIRKARGTMNAPTPITTGDALFTESSFGYVGATNAYLEATRIEHDSTGTISDGVNGIGGTIKLMTTKATVDSSPQVGYTLTGGSTPVHTFAGTIVPSSFGIQGIAAVLDAPAGNIGEIISATLAVGSLVTLTTNTTANITNISLTAGDWDVTCVVTFQYGATTSITNLIGGISNTSATLDVVNTYFDYETAANVPTAGADSSWVCPTVRKNVGITTTVYLVAQATFTVSTLKAYGTIRARRMR